MARKLPSLRRELGAGSLFSVGYGEIAASIYFALGIIALHAVGFTPLVLLGVGLLFLVVALSYAEASSALFVPLYLAGAFQVGALDRKPWDVVLAVTVIFAVGAIRFLRRPSFYAF